MKTSPQGPSMLSCSADDLARGIAAHLGTAEKLVTDIPGLTIFQRAAPTPPCCLTYEPSISVVAQGRKRVELGQNVFHYGSSHFLLTSVDLPVITCVTEASALRPCLALTLKIDMSVVRKLLSQREPGLNSPPSGGTAMATGELTADLLNACCRLLGLLDTSRDIPFLSGPIQEEIVYRVLRSSAGPRLSEIAMLSESSQRTARAISHIRDNYPKPLSVEQLAGIAGMGVSTLHHHFRVLTAMSPLQYQKQLRLQAARSRMLVEGMDVGSTAFEVGYESVSQFSREYSRFFGQPPLRDIKGLRSSARDPLSQ